jgi:hypothetical protein
MRSSCAGISASARRPTSSDAPWTRLAVRTRPLLAARSTVPVTPSNCPSMMSLSKAPGSRRAAQ